MNNFSFAWLAQDSLAKNHLRTSSLIFISLIRTSNNTKHVQSVVYSKWRVVPWILPRAFRTPPRNSNRAGLPGPSSVNLLWSLCATIFKVTFHFISTSHLTRHSIVRRRPPNVPIIGDATFLGGGGDSAMPLPWGQKKSAMAVKIGKHGICFFCESMVRHEIPRYETMNTLQS